MAAPVTRLRDRDVRQAIHQQVVPTLVGGSPSRVLDELLLGAGDARVDVAVVNGRLHGVEIKSEADTLERLPRQIEVYSRVFDTVTIVCGGNHLVRVQARVPSWWGIMVARPRGGEVCLERVRPASDNPAVEKLALAQLLWKDELITLLGVAGQGKGATRKPCRVLWGLVAEAYGLEGLQSAVRTILKGRSDWRPDELQK